MSEPDNSPGQDPYWWTPWAVLIALVLLGALGFSGKLSSTRGGPTAADVPVETPAPSASAR